MLLDILKIFNKTYGIIFIGSVRLIVRIQSSEVMLCKKTTFIFYLFYMGLVRVEYHKKRRGMQASIAASRVVIHE